MSTRLETKLTEHDATEFWGGDARGVCVQIFPREPIRLRETASEQIQEEGFIQLTMEEASALANCLSEFVSREAKRRQGLLRDHIAGLQQFEKTVFREVADLPGEFFEAPTLAVLAVAKFCPKVRPRIGEEPK